MDLSTFIADPDRHAALAGRIGTSKAWLWQIATNWRGKRASFTMAQDIERVSAEIGPEAVSKSSLRPDIWPPAEENGSQPACADVNVEAPQGAESEVDRVHAGHDEVAQGRAA